MRFVSVLVDGERRAGILDGEVVFVSDAPGLDVAIVGIVRTPDVPVPEFRAATAG